MSSNGITQLTIIIQKNIVKEIENHSKTWGS